MSSRTMFSPLWHRVETLRPRLKPGVRLERQLARGEVWYIARDRLSGKVYRFSLPVRALLMRMDGSRTVGQIWSDVVEEFGEDAPAQDEVIHAIGQLYGADLLNADGSIDMHELSDRSERMRRKQAIQRYQNPLYFKLPLANPNRFLDATLHLVRPAFSKWGFAVWLGAVAWLVLMAAMHWHQLASNAADRLLAPANILVLLIIFPVLKLIHELGHAYATKVRGGEVPEIGIMFLVFAPAPYVDASSSALFPRKWDRVLVGAAGMMVELFVAALAMAVWLAVEAGPVRATAYNVMVIAGASTLLFNGNPLLRFDAYFILSDLVEIPNLASRSTQYWGYLAKRYALGLRAAAPPSTGRGEERWFLAYAPLAYVYRLFVVFSIALFIGAQYFFVGVLLAIWTVVISVLMPFAKVCKFVFASPELSHARGRAVLAFGGGVAAILAAVCVVPLPYGTIAEGIVWSPGEVRIVADTAGIVSRFKRQPGETVARGDVLIEMEDPYAAAQKRLAQARLDELRHRLAAAETSSPVEIELVRQRVSVAENDLAETERRLAALTLLSPSDGVFIVPQGNDLIGRFSKRGTLVGYVMPEREPTLRVAVPESDIDTVRTLTRSVSVRLASGVTRSFDGIAMVREIPGATHKLPSPALATPAGGPFTVDPSASAPDTSVLPFFDMELALPAAVRPGRWGERVHVRFDHGTAPLASQLSRKIRQIFLAHFNA